MCIVPVFVGLDYHQDSVQVCVIDETGRKLSNCAVVNDVLAIEQASRRHGTPRQLAIEACCRAADLAERLTVERGMPVLLAHPGYVNRLKRSPDKTGLADAQLLADLTRVNYLPAVWLPHRRIDLARVKADATAKTEGAHGSLLQTQNTASELRREVALAAVLGLRSSTDRGAFPHFRKTQRG